MPQLVRRRAEFRPYLRAGQPLGLYVLTMAAVAVAYGIGYALNGVEGLGPFLRSMAGSANVWLLTLLLAFLLLFVERSQRLGTMVLAVAGFVVLGLVFSILQRGFYALGWPLTWQFYAGADHQAPLLTMQAEGRFTRSFGSFYSPTIFGTTLLLALSLLFARFVYAREEGKRHGPRLADTFALLGLVALSIHLGIMAFAKTVIIGVPFLLIYMALVLPLLLRLSQRWLRAEQALPRLRHGRGRTAVWPALVVLLTVAAASYFVTWFIIPSWQPGARAYYYGFLVNPISSLATRYAIGAGEQLRIDRGADAITISALLQFYEHPVFGVGPLMVDGEFIGDSQFTSVLHNGGIVATLAYLALYLRIFWIGLMSRDRVVLVMLPAVVLGCFAAVLFDNRQSLPFIAALLVAAAAAGQDLRLARDRMSQKRSETREPQIDTR